MGSPVSAPWRQMQYEALPHAPVTITSLPWWTDYVYKLWGKINPSFLKLLFATATRKVSNTPSIKTTSVHPQIPNLLASLVNLPVSSTGGSRPSTQWYFIIVTYTRAFSAEDPASYLTKTKTKLPERWGDRTKGILTHCCWEYKMVKPLWKTGSFFTTEQAYHTV